MKLRTLAFIAVAPIAFAACSSSSSDTKEPVSTTTTVVANAVGKYELRIGENSSPTNVVEFKKGQEVQLTFINAKAADEVHLHGYDLSTGDMEIGAAATISFTADVTGDFEVESHKTEDVLMIVRIIK